MSIWASFKNFLFSFGLFQNVPNKNAISHFKWSKIFYRVQNCHSNSNITFCIWHRLLLIFHASCSSQCAPLHQSLNNHGLITVMPFQPFDQRHNWENNNRRKPVCNPVRSTFQITDSNIFSILQQWEDRQSTVSFFFSARFSEGHQTNIQIDLAAEKWDGGDSSEAHLHHRGPHSLSHPLRASLIAYFASLQSPSLSHFTLVCVYKLFLFFLFLPFFVLSSLICWIVLVVKKLEEILDLQEFSYAYVYNINIYF